MIPSPKRVLAALTATFGVFLPWSAAITQQRGTLASTPQFTSATITRAILGDTSLWNHQSEHHVAIREIRDPSGRLLLPVLPITTRIDRFRMAPAQWRTETVVEGRYPVGSVARALDSAQLADRRAVVPGDGSPFQLLRRDGSSATSPESRALLERFLSVTGLDRPFRESGVFGLDAPGVDSALVLNSKAWIESRFPSPDRRESREAAYRHEFGAPVTRIGDVATYERRSDTTTTTMRVEERTQLRATIVVRYGRAMVDSTEFLYTPSPTGVLIHTGFANVRTDVKRRRVSILRVEYRDITIDRARLPTP